MVTILQKGDSLLRKKAKPVPIEEIETLAIKKMLDEMRAGIKTRDDAVAIAAPQIGYSLRMFLVSKQVFIAEEKNPDAEDMVFINPVVTKLSRKKVKAEEGCLSVDTWYGNTKRAEKITVRAYNEHGERFERGASGLLAQIIQHEIDHLNGILLTDHATDLVQLSPPARTTALPQS
jgi:peptide deformylase